VRRLLLVLLVLAACSGPPADATPTGAVQAFLAALDRSNREPEAMTEAFALLSASDRRALSERAHLAGALGGRRFEGWEMLVQGRFRLNFAPRDGAAGFVEQVAAGEGFVEVRGEDGAIRYRPGCPRRGTLAHRPTAPAGPRAPG
jgi:hypothetical protein